MFSIVLTTVKDRREANRISQALVSEKLAACVSIVPNVTSIYRWQGKIEGSREIILVIKTSAKKIDRLMSRIKELHSYQVPEIISLNVQRGLPQYLKWLKESLD
ncbi:MAG: divalent-cation tolerance protein CutA [Candidatus Hadarchaeum sp.]|uniref:divalent-cation tolerance protein CutA n=1 Tax=Candidatus Hadarchaeum sp. TaxID=2883567 RepID=UPI003172A2E5